MDSRFRRVWDGIQSRRARGERFDRLLSECTTPELVAALAAVGGTDDVAANALATELLNRYRRAPFLGAFAVAVTALIVFAATELVVTGDFLPLGAGPIGRSMAAFAVVVLVACVLSLLLWRGRLPAIQAALARRRHF